MGDGPYGNCGKLLIFMHLMDLSIPENFKRNMELCEQSLLGDSSNVATEICNARDWVEYFHHLVAEALPKIAKAIMQRKYSANQSNLVELAKEFVIVLAMELSRHFGHLEDEGAICSLFSEVVDPNSPFFRKFGYPKPLEEAQISRNSKVTSEQQKLIDSLELDMFLDYKPPAGKWDNYVVTFVDAARKSIELRRIDDDQHRVTVNLETEAANLTVLGKMTTGGQEEANNENIDPMGGNAAFSVATSALPDEMLLGWSDTLVQGSLVDALDISTNIWYQACVMEVQTIEVAPSSAAAAAPGAEIMEIVDSSSTSMSGQVAEEAASTAVTAAVATASAKLVGEYCAEAANSQVSEGTLGDVSLSVGDISIDVSSQCGESEHHGVVDPSFHMVQESEYQEGPTASNDHDSDKENLNEFDGSSDYGSDLDHQHALDESNYTEPQQLQYCDDDKKIGAMVVEEAAVEILDADENEMIPTGAPCVVVEDAPTEPPTPIVETRRRLRIAYLGFPERNDEWIWVDADFTRIRPLNEMSRGRRGDLPIREEVFYLASMPAGDRPPGGEMETFAVAREGSLYSLYFVELVNRFGFDGGFDNCREYLKHLHGAAIQGIRPRFENAFHVIIGLSRMSCVMSKSFLASFTPAILDAIAGIVKHISIEEYREISVELLETLLESVEKLAVAHFGRNAAAGDYESLWNRVAFTLLSTPYLNKRLGGLKILGELLRRAQSSRDYPMGLRTTITTASNGVESVSYKVVPILYKTRLIDLCETIISSGCLIDLFQGNQAHYSLMARSTEVLKFLASENCITQDLLGVIWNAGYQSKKSAAFTALAEVMKVLSSHRIFVCCDEWLRSTSASSVTPESVEVFSAAAQRTRTLLFEEKKQENKDSILLAHVLVFNHLWSWVVSEECSVNAKNAALASVESLFSVDHRTPTIANNSQAAVQHERCHQLIGTVCEAIRQKRALAAAVKILQAYLNSWPFVETSACRYSRSHVSANMEKEYGIIALLVEAIESLDPDCCFDKVPASDGLLSRLTEFVNFYLRFADDQLILTTENIERIWTKICVVSKTEDQLSVAVSFLSRLFNNIYKGTPSPDAIAEELDGLPTSAVTFDVGSDHAAHPAKSRTSLCSLDSIRYIFDHLLCSSSFLECPHFPANAVDCIEKYFRRLNASKGFIVENKAKLDPFRIVEDPTRLIGLNVFFDIILCAASDAVAASVVKLLVGMPKRLSLELQQAGQQNLLRRSFLGKALTRLYQFRDSNEENLSRLLMILEGLIDSSLDDCKGRYIPHWVPPFGSPVTIKLSSSSKLLQPFLGELHVSSNMLVENLIQRIADRVQCDQSNLKMFCNGKELALHGRKKMLAEIKIVKTAIVMLVDKLPKSGVVTGTNSPRNNSPRFISHPEVPVEELPAVILAESKDHFDLLFELLDAAGPETSDRIWELIVDLPTPTRLVADWTELKCDSISDLLKQQGRRVGRLYYVLKFIEKQLNPLNSRMDWDEWAKDEKHSVEFHKMMHDRLNWIGRFVGLGGIEALVDSLEWTLLALDGYVGSGVPSTPRSRGSPQLFLKTVTQHCIILRGILGHVCHRSKPGLLLQVYHLADAPAHAEGINKMSLESMSKDAANRESAFLQKSWGWMISEVFENSPPANTLCWSRLHRLTVLSMALMRRFANDPLFATENLPKWRTLDGCTACREFYKQCMLCLFIIWSVTASMEPSVIGSFQRPHDVQRQSAGGITNRLLIENGSQIDLATFLKEFLLGGGARPVDLPSLDEFHTLLGGWSVQFVLSLILLLENVRVRAQVEGYPELAASSKSALERFRRDLFVTLLEIRPPVFSDDLSNSVVERKASAGPLYLLASSLLSPKSKLENRNNQDGTSIAVPFEDEDGALETTEDYRKDNQCDGSFLPLQDRIQLSRKLFHELKAAYDALQTRYESQQPSPVFQQVAGTFGLLRSLASGAIAVIETLYSDGLLHFLLGPCLGLVKSEKEGDEKSCSPTILRTSPAPNLCNDEVSRSSAYELLFALCQWNPSVAANVAFSIYHTHKAVPILSTWSFKPESMSKSSTGYVGLKNLGCTCYMNSLIQVLFNIPELRDAILEAPTNRLQLSDDEIKNNELIQLQKMFLNLLYSEKKMFSPNEWAFAYKDDTGMCPINVMQQQDAQEFLQVLCDRLEQRLAVLDSLSSTPSSLLKQPYRSIFTRHFGGSICNLMVNDGVQHGLSSRPSSETASVAEDFDIVTPPLSPQSPTMSKIREQNEPFVCISLEVKGCEGLEQSLSKFVEGEEISEFIWTENEPRVTITKRQCISHLSDSVIFHLKRFELNFDTFRREKVNDRFSFPTSIDMRPYTKEFILHSELKSDEYYLFELRAIVVHTGTSDSGHYFSYIRDRDEVNANGRKKWLEFNDGEVKEFSDLLIESECFGGMTVMHEVSDATTQTYSIENPKSAYMLVYERSKMSANQLLPFAQEQGLTQFRDELQNIKVENETHVLMSTVLCRQHIEFLGKLADTLQTHTLSLQHEELRSRQSVTRPPKFIVPMELLCPLVQFWIRVISHSAHLDLVKSTSAQLVRLLEGASDPNTVSHSGISRVSSTDSLEATHSTASTSSTNPAYVRGKELDIFSLEYAKSSKTTCAVVLRQLRVECDVTTMPLLFAGEKDVRMAFKDLLGKLLTTAFTEEDVLSLSSRELARGVSKESELQFPPPVPQQHQQKPAVSMTEEEELMEAIRLSQQEATSGHSLKSLALYGGQSVVAVDPNAADDLSNTAGHFIVELTMPTRVSQLAEVWRRSDALSALFSLLASHSVKSRQLLNYREMIWQLIDVIVGNQSPVQGQLYMPGTRKRAPSSYVLVGPPNQLGVMPYAAKNIPDWTDLVEALTKLICACRSHSMSYYPPVVPSTVIDGGFMIMDRYSDDCCHNRTFLATILKQARYTLAALPLIPHLCTANWEFSSTISDILFESISMSSYDTAAHVFTAIEVFLSIADNFRASRVNTMFMGEVGLLQVLCGMKDQSLKQKDLCVFLASLLHLIAKIPLLNSMLSAPLSYQSWAPWMLKFSFQFREKGEAEKALNQVVLESSSAASKAPKLDGAASAASVSTTPKGPFVVVYGESENDRELTWPERANRLFDRLQQTVQSMGGDVQTLIPVDAFAPVPAEDEELSSAMAIATANDSNDVTALGYVDGMSDEELARYLQSQ